MPQTRKRHPHTIHQKPSDVPATQRTKGRTIWTLLLGVFGLVIAFVSAGANYAALIISAALGAVIGYFIGKKMEQEATKKS